MSQYTYIHTLRDTVSTPQTCLALASAATMAVPAGASMEPLDNYM